MKINLNTIQTSMKSAKNFLVESYKDAREISRENNVYKDIKDLVNEIKEAREIGKIYTAGITDEPAKQIIDTSHEGLSAYAKANKLNITFHTPQKPCEVGSNDFEKPLSVTVCSSGLFNSKIREKTIDGDINKITTFSKDNVVNIGDKKHSTTSTYEDTFTRRVFRAVSDLTNEIYKK